MNPSHKYFPVNDAQKAWGIYATCIGHSLTAPYAKFPSSIHPDEYFFTWDKGRILNEWQFILVEKDAASQNSAKADIRSMKVP